MQKKKKKIPCDTSHDLTSPHHHLIPHPLLSFSPLPLPEPLKVVEINNITNKSLIFSLPSWSHLENYQSFVDHKIFFFAFLLHLHCIFGFCDYSAYLCI